MTNLAFVDDYQFKPFICPTCKCAISDEKMHGWVRSDFGAHTGWKAQILPCPTCSDLAIAQVRREQIDRLLGNSHLPVYARDWNFATTPGGVDLNAVATCANFSNQQGKPSHGLYIYGDPGVGKTGLAISIIQAVMARGIDAMFIRSIDLMNRLRDAIAHGTHDGDDLLALVKRVAWLALDDLATERPTPYVLEQLYAIIEDRRSSGLYTVFTSNYSTRELEAQWRPDTVRAGAFHAGKRITERLNEYCLAVHIKSSNLRRVVDAQWVSPDESKIRPIRGN